MMSAGMFDFLVRLGVTFNRFSQIFFISDISKSEIFQRWSCLVKGCKFLCFSSK